MPAVTVHDQHCGGTGITEYPDLTRQISRDSGAGAGPYRIGRTVIGGSELYLSMQPAARYGPPPRKQPVPTRNTSLSFTKQCVAGALLPAVRNTIQYHIRTIRYNTILSDEVSRISSSIHPTSPWYECIASSGSIEGRLPAIRQETPSRYHTVRTIRY